MDLEKAKKIQRYYDYFRWTMIVAIFIWVLLTI